MTRAALTQDLIPGLERKGFKTLPLDTEDRKSAEIKNAFPFGRMIRTAGQDIHLLEIQLDKHNPQKFRINFGKAPIGGINHPHTGHIEAKDIWVHYLPEYYEAYAWPLFRVWLNSDAEKLWPHILHQIDDALERGTIGRFVRRIKAYAPPTP